MNGETSAALDGTLTFSRVAGETVGAYAITPAGLTSTNYVITFASGTLTISQAALTITADNQSKAYGMALPGLTVSYSGLVNGDTAASLTTPPAVTTTGRLAAPRAATRSRPVALRMPTIRSATWPARWRSTRWA